MNNTENGTKKKILGNWGCGRVFWTAGLVVFGGIFLLLLYSVIDVTELTPRRNVRDLQAYIPQAKEMFEQSREHLDVLVNGEFLNKDRWATAGALRGGDDLYWLEELPAQEVDALIFLLTGDKLERNFGIIRSDLGGLGALIIHRGTASMEITHGGSSFGVFASHYGSRHRESLGGGYELWVYARAPHGMGVGIMMTLAFLAGAVATVFLIGLIVFLGKNKSREPHVKRFSEEDAK